ncbi:MAG: DUF1553 domain-containing protein [Planctomycetes bacterium]|nr:DUF1553 domain-containing protein [Planctomycetota bacterium]
MATITRRPIWLLSSLLLLSALTDPLTAQTRIEYNRDVRPILAENCFACHGPDSASRKAGLRLDQREAAIKMGAITPGKLKDSALIERIHSDNPKERMPPPKTLKKLTAAQKEILKRWIAQGAEYQSHWSLIAPKRTPLPAVKNKAWARNPIDYFILAELEKRGMKPNPEADRRTLARRLSLDLTGLPPSPAEVEAFVTDKAPDYYEKYVDKLMKSPHWGEHRARYWLDAARYADTHGIHFDNFREVHAYRDWVIDAFNKNQPFDQFTIDQLAGDLLPNPTLDQLVATGFNRCNITSNEGGLIPEEYLVMYTRDRTETVAAVWLGATLNCCTCHSHKFDPFSQKDFYSFSAFFNNTTQGAMDGNIRNTPPVIFVPRREDRPRWNVLAKEIAALKGQIEDRKKNAQKEFDQWLSQAKAEQVAALVPTEGLTLHARLNEGKGNTLHATIDGKPRDLTFKAGYDWVAGKGMPKTFTVRPTGPAIELPDVGDFENSQGFSIGAWVKIPRRGNVGAIAARMDTTQKFRGWDLWMEQDKVGMHIINQWPENALKVTAKTPLQPNRWYHVFVTYDGSSKAAGVKVYLDGALQPVDVFTDKLSQTIKTRVPLKIGQRHTDARLKDVSLQDLRFYGKKLSGPEVQQLAKSSKAADFLAKAPGKRTPAERAELFDWWLVALDGGYRALNEKIAAIQQEEVVMKSRGTIAHVMNEAKSEPIAYVLFRGEYDKRRDKVSALTPGVLPPMPKDLPRNRLGVAKWLLRPENPLPARVTVNRFWQEIFGTGIVRTTGDFGVAGELPSHPELLDWLALEFMDPLGRSPLANGNPLAKGERLNAWDIQRLFKLMVTSATYRQTATVTKDALEKDRDNRFLGRASRYRMDAEMIRDYALASSGLLVRKIGGPSVKPYMPDGVWEAVAMIGSNTRDYRRDTGEKLYRRSMYTFWKRAAPPASMDILNAPNRETCTVRRERTNTPLQALVTLNDVQFIEAARHLAQAALKDGGASDDSKINFIAMRLLSRPFRAAEMKIVQGSLNDLREHYKTREADARKLITVGESQPDASLDARTLAAWTMVVNQLMNLDEVLNK